jgi:hypothetical protein
MTRRRIILGLVGVLLAVFVYVGFIQTPPGPRTLRMFDPDRMAALELDMWQAYYARENVRLFRGLVTSLHEQNRYPWSKAVIAGFRLARAASTFADLRSDYEQVLPDLERAYAIAAGWTNAGFSPAAVARAELAWWVARRVPGQNSAEHIGALIADEYALLYEVPRARVVSPALWRARAARLRDEGGEHADWPTVSRLLHQSYRELHDALRGGTP